VKSASLDEKYKRWQTVELAVIQARENLGQIPKDTHHDINAILNDRPIDGKWIDEREKIVKHDLNAFIEERMRHLPVELQAYWHKGMTSYDTEEAAFAMMLSEACLQISMATSGLLREIRNLSIKYRYTPMNGRTHGQEAEMQSFGKRCLTWYCDLRAAQATLRQQMDNLKYSKLSGAIGTNSGVSPEVEEEALKLLGLLPWIGATQIMPRVLYAPIADALANQVLVVEKIALDIRLMSRSGHPLCHEPFGKLQKGSSAMPHKKNNIGCENTAGMATMAAKYAEGIRQNIVTWEERAIEQSCVERVFWPDLFHVTIKALKTMTSIVGGMKVYPDNMMIEIIESRGTYASNAAKEFLTEHGLQVGLSREECYRIVQLACANAFQPSEIAQTMREVISKDLMEADNDMDTMKEICAQTKIISICTIIEEASLRTDTMLDADKDTVAGWNKKLDALFRDEGIVGSWNNLFLPSYSLVNEDHLFQKAFDII